MYIFIQPLHQQWSTAGLNSKVFSYFQIGCLRVKTYILPYYLSIIEREREREREREIGGERDRRGREIGGGERDREREMGGER